MTTTPNTTPAPRRPPFGVCRGGSSHDMEPPLLGIRQPAPVTRYGASGRHPSSVGGAALVHRTMPSQPNKCELHAFRLICVNARPARGAPSRY